MFSVLSGFVFLTIFMCVFCDNVTNQYRFSDQFNTRQNRLLSFNTLDGGDISIELAFNVPFISIPVKKSLEMANGAIANLNLGAVILSGAIIFGIAVFIPGIFLFFTKKLFTPPSYRRDENDLPIWRYMHSLDDVLLKNDIDVTSCVQRAVCASVKRSSKNVFSGNSSSSDKIIDGLATSGWLQNAIHETAIHSALNDGLEGVVNCRKKYENCRVTKRAVEGLFKKFLLKFNT